MPDTTNVSPSLPETISFQEKIFLKIKYFIVKFDHALQKFVFFQKMTPSNAPISDKAKARVVQAKDPATLSPEKKSETSYGVLRHIQKATMKVIRALEVSLSFYEVISEVIDESLKTIYKKVSQFNKKDLEIFLQEKIKLNKKIDKIFSFIESPN